MEASAKVKKAGEWVVARAGNGHVGAQFAGCEWGQCRLVVKGANRPEEIGASRVKAHFSPTL